MPYTRSERMVRHLLCYYADKLGEVAAAQRQLHIIQQVRNNAVQSGIIRRLHVKSVTGLEKVRRVKLRNDLVSTFLARSLSRLSRFEKRSHDAR
jgi:hypothetical protein